ncbi:hypothetical protein [Marinomonas sp. 2405UD68-3]|uniref:hypothetical protein n=1 Tax=Marinomonas sp. 2405UD68-3 TaxID=3391835 RepID=UPI0039C8D96C
MKKTLTLAMLFTLSTTVSADTFNVSVSLNKQEVPLTISQTQPMAFPELVINRATNVGAVCRAHPIQLGKTDEERLCAATRGIGKTANFILSGIPHADLTWTVPGQSQEQDGLRFIINEINSANQASHQKLDASGNLAIIFHADIILADHALAMQSPGVKTFTYELIAAYQ